MGGTALVPNSVRTELVRDARRIGPACAERRR